MIPKILKTICAIANNGRHSTGKIIIGVTDKNADAVKAREIDKIEPKKIGKRFVVGVQREADRLGINMEQYFAKWKDGIKKSDLSPELASSVTSNMDYNSFYGLGLIIISIPPQNSISYLGEQVYWRNGDATELAKTPKEIATVAKRF